MPSAVNVMLNLSITFSVIRYCRSFPLISFIVVTRDYQGKRLNPHIELLTKVIPPKLFLDMVPRSSADISRAIRGQPKPLSRNYLRRNGGNGIVYVLILFHCRDVFCTLDSLLVLAGFRVYLCSFGWSIFGRLFGFKEFN